MERGVRFGVLGAARITPNALIEPAQRLAGATVQAVAARDRARAVDFAAQHDIPCVHDTYAQLIREPAIDAVYIGLPAALHARWAIEALRAGKHVLCEKPIACNAREAAEMVSVADETGLVLCEAMHYRYHPMADRIVAAVGSGVLGAIESIEAEFLWPIPDRTDIRYRADLGGGALMDLGCYAVHWIRLAARDEPTVISAAARQDPPGIDVVMDAELCLPSGATATLRCGMATDLTVKVELRVRGDRGQLVAVNPMAPHAGAELTVCDEATHWAPGEGQTTYDSQLEAFVTAVRGGGAPPTAGQDSVRNMRVIDAIYLAAGMRPREAVSWQPWV